jgi:osmoprotectant transport system permease protein
VLAILVDALLVAVRLLLTPWMPRRAHPKPKAGTPDPAALALEDAAR